MMPRPRPETNENLATKARRHKGFIYNKTFCVTLCLGVLVANFTAGKLYTGVPLDISFPISNNSLGGLASSLTDWEVDFLGPPSTSMC